MTALATVKEIDIPIQNHIHKGILGVPENATGIVLFAHGSGSSRLSPRNNYVAEVIREGNVATLLFDLLTEEEDRNYDTRFDITLLTQRLIEVTQWLDTQDSLKDLKIGYFGASTGAAAALQGAAALGSSMIKTVVSRGGRPDLAGADLSRVSSPVLLIVGGFDDVVIELNEQAFAAMEKAEIKELKIVPGATHLFEEPCTLEQAAELAKNWFAQYLG